MTSPTHVPASATHHVLLGNEALDEAVRVLLFEDVREGGILGVPVQGNDTVASVAQLGQGLPVGLAGSDLWRGE